MMAPDGEVPPPGVLLRWRPSGRVVDGRSLCICALPGETVKQEHRGRELDRWHFGWTSWSLLFKMGWVRCTEL